MSNLKNAHAVNESLRALQQQWYNNLPEKYRYTDVNKSEEADIFSSPFCFGVSEVFSSPHAPLIMYVGEEPSNWWFKEEERRLDYVQGCSIAYFDRQMRKSAEPESIYENKYSVAYTDGVIKRNKSQFWNLLRKLKKELNVSVCWNDLDKLHRIGKAKKTVKLNDFSHSEQVELHLPFNETKRSLLWQEIDLLKPDVIIFMGSDYRQSIEAALSLSDNKLEGKAPRLQINQTVTDISNECSESLTYRAKVLWMCHPTSLTRNKEGSFYRHTFDRIKYMINYR
ncbi:MAG: hypothetical protein E7673_06485 [Ruminococcaceae bacterium]|nr:hypothetical protein [Oscillospiraceae bacterium]